MSSRPPGGGALGSGASLMSAVAALERAEESDRAAHARLRSELAAAYSARAAAEAAAADSAGVADAARQSAEHAWRERDAAVDAARALEARLEARTPATVHLARHRFWLLARALCFQTHATEQNG